MIIGKSAVAEKDYHFCIAKPEQRQRENNLLFQTKSSVFSIARCTAVGPVMQEAVCAAVTAFCCETVDGKINALSRIQI